MKTKRATPVSKNGERSFADEGDKHPAMPVEPVASSNDMKKKNQPVKGQQDKDAGNSDASCGDGDSIQSQPSEQAAPASIGGIAVCSTKTEAGDAAPSEPTAPPEPQTVEGLACEAAAKIAADEGSERDIQLTRARHVHEFAERVRKGRLKAPDNMDPFRVLEAELAKKGCGIGTSQLRNLHLYYGVRSCCPTPPDVSMTVYIEVAKRVKDDAKRLEWLQRAELEKMSVSQVRQEITGDPKGDPWYIEGFEGNIDIAVLAVAHAAAELRDAGRPPSEEEIERVKDLMLMVYVSFLAGKEAVLEKAA